MPCELVPEEECFCEPTNRAYLSCGAQIETFDPHVSESKAILIGEAAGTAPSLDEASHLSQSILFLPMRLQGESYTCSTAACVLSEG